IKQAADAASAKLVLVNLTRPIEKAFRSARFLPPDIQAGNDIDRALEACENAIISAHRADDTGTRTLHGWLTDALNSAYHAAALERYCRRIEVAAGEVIARQGEPANSMHFILEGRVGIIVSAGSGHSVRVRSLG